jgi:molybdopterin/thiamine biosynthesis adenylyltransferase
MTQQEMFSILDTSAPFSREQLAGYNRDMLGSHILVLGAGALGSALVTQLSMWGFFSALIVDFDTYDISNATRVLDFPYRSVLSGKQVGKAGHLASIWRRRLRSMGVESHDVRAHNTFAQELPPSEWKKADLVLGAVDHPRARFDCARIARRYGKPFLSGGFDGEHATVTIRFFPGALDAACVRCTHVTIPDYAAASASCQSEGRRAQEARKLPATPSLAGLCASWMVQMLVDGLRSGFPASTQRLDLRLRGPCGCSLAEISRVAADPGCPEHRPSIPILKKLYGRTLGEFLRSLDDVLSGATLVPLSPLVVHAGTPRGLRLAHLPSWRLRRDVLDNLPPADSTAYPLALDELNAQVAERYNLSSLPLSHVGLGPGARFEVGGTATGIVEWG